MPTPTPNRWPAVTLPLIPLLLTLPLLKAPSCGHDFGFHIQSWMDAGQQLRHGHYPSWAFSPAFNAGEPRFVFYPPLSWLLGSLLLLTLPSNATPAAFTFVALLLAALGMFALARRYTSATGALLASTAYLANPYLLFTAFERTAFAELLAAAWIPWLLRATLAPTPRILPLALPLAALWLTNAPAAVMGTYTLALIFLVRLFLRTPEILIQDAKHARNRTLGLDLPLATTAIASLLLGLALAGFYLLPAALERPNVEIAMAIIPNMRIEDNFPFGHTGYGPHDAVLHTASLVTLAVVLLAAAALLAATLRTRRQPVPALKPLWLLALFIGILLSPHALPLWHHLPELAFLQFPWRWLSILGCVFALAIAIALGRARPSATLTIPLTLLIASTAGTLALHPGRFREACDAHELPADRLALFQTHHGVGPTDEYTPKDADNDQLRWDDPAFWLAGTLNAPAPGTVPNPASTIPDYDEPPPLSQTVSRRAPLHLQLHLDHPEDLILNLRRYPAWTITRNGHPIQPEERDDGLLAVPLPAGDDTVDIHWQRLPDVWAGEALSLAALLVTGALLFQSRRIKNES